MFYWAEYQHYFDRAGGSTSSILSFYVAQAISIFLLLLGLRFAYKYLRMRSSYCVPVKIGSSERPAFNLTPFLPNDGHAENE